MNTQQRVRWARKLCYAARDDGESSCASYIAFLELTNKRDGPPLAYALYRRVMPYRGYDPRLASTRMVRLRPQGTREEMIARFWLFPPEGQEGNDFPDYQSVLWRDTTTWLDRVAAGGWHESCSYESGGRPGRWARVGTPASWQKRHNNKKPLRFGFTPHIVLRLRAEIKAVEAEMAGLENRQEDLTHWDIDLDCEYVWPENRAEYEDLERQHDRLLRERSFLHVRIEALVEQMRVEVRVKFPTPLGKTPKRELRKQKRQYGLWA